MLPELIIQQWLKESKIGERVKQIGTAQIITLRKFFDWITILPANEVRDRLSEGDKQQNLDLSWWLLHTALNLEINEIDKVKKCVDWAEFIARYGSNLAHQEEVLKAHCEFYKGVLNHQTEELSAAQLSYAKAEDGYRNTNASLNLQGLAIYAQGAVALEADDLEGNRMLYGGSQERFPKALEVLSQPVSQIVKQQVQDVIDRSLQQWQLMNELIETDQPDEFLDRNFSAVDRQLLQILRSRMLNLAVDQQPAAETLKVARLAEKVGNSIGETVDYTEQLLSFYWISRRLEDAELILREQVEFAPDRLDLQKKLARVLFLQGKYVAMRDLLTGVLREWPNHAEIHGLLSNALLGLNDNVGADFHARRAREIDVNEYHAALTLQELEAAKPKATVTFKDGNLTIDSGFADLAATEKTALITAAILAEQPDLVATSLEQIAHSDPDLANRVISILQTNSILPSPALPPAIEHYQRAEQFFSQALWSEAMQAYQQAIAADRDFAKAYMGLGDVYYRIGQYYVAIAHFEESLALQPDPYTYRFLGDAYNRVGKRKQAIVAYRQALSLEPNYTGARQALQDSLEQEEQEDEPIRSE